ncbi:MAG: pitrilysin family protein [Gemmataceae bacterium]
MRSYFVVAVLALSASATFADDAVQKTAAALYDGIRVETLPNGLRVYLKAIPGSPVVSTMVAYKVGSADEELDSTGLSHYLEHLMFKGTEKLVPGDIDRMTLRSGGRNNAYTTEDLTNYHFDFAAENWETALAIEADRMRNLRIDAKHEFEQEKGAVISELQMNEDQPFDLELKAILPILFGKTGPYGHPVIGERDHVRGATAEIIKGHYDRWYYPNNASLVVVGGFDEGRALSRIKELFGPIPSGKLPARKTAKAVDRSTPARIEMTSKFEMPRLVMGFPGVKVGDPDYYPLEIIQAVLSGGKTSRLYKKLVESEEIASEASASDNAGRYPGWFSVTVELLKGKSREKAEELVLGELKRLVDEPVNEAELKRVKQGLLASAIFQREGVHELADSIARGVTLADLDYLKTLLPKLMAVTAAEVQATAKKYLDPSKRAVVWSVPPGVPADKGGSAGSNKPDKPSRAAGGTSAGAYDVKATQRMVLPNGITLLLLENHRLPIVAADAFVRNTRLSEPADKAGIASLVGTLLDEGTATRTSDQIATAIEDVGGSLSMSSSGGSVKVLSPDRSLGLKLLIDCLTHPSFPKDALERKRAQILSALLEADQRADVRAQRAFAEMVYPKGHPLARAALGTTASVEKLTADDCRAFHATRFLPNTTTIAVVGDFVASEVIAEIKALTADWKQGIAPKLDLPAIEKQVAFSQKVITMPSAEQLYFYLGHPGIRRTNPDYLKLLVMDYVLGTGPGFTDRLSSSLRDRQGLAYTVSANITSSAGDEPGTFTCYISTFPDKFVAVKDGFMTELKRIRAEAATKDEVEDAKKYLLGSLAFRFTTGSSVAEQIVSLDRFGLGFDYFDRYRKEVAAVTPADVLEVARKYLDPDRMILVASGAVKEDGAPLAKPKKP